MPKNFSWVCHCYLNDSYESLANFLMKAIVRLKISTMPCCIVLLCDSLLNFAPMSYGVEYL